MKTKSEMVAIVKEVFEIKTNSEALEKFNALEVKLFDALVEDGGYKLAGVTVKTKPKKASKGTCKGIAWSKPAHIAPKASFTNEVKEAVYKEIQE